MSKQKWRMQQRPQLPHCSTCVQHSSLKPSLTYLLLAFTCFLFSAHRGSGTPANAGTPEKQKPNWIWAEGKQRQHTPVLFEKKFQLRHQGTTALLKFSPCYSNLQISIDGALIANATAYQGMQEIKLGQPLAAGSHSMTVRAVGIDGPSAFFTELTLAHRNHPTRIISTGSDWRASIPTDSDEHEKAPATIVNLGPIEDAFSLPKQRRVGIDAWDNYEQWKLALPQGTNKTQDAPAFATTENFQIREVNFSTTPELDLGSWVSMTIDSEGRLIIAREASGLLRLTLSPQGDAITSTEWINRDLKECRGLAFRGKELFVNANNSKGLYRLRPEGTGYGRPELIYSSSGGVGHGRNDLVVGPDNMLYSIHGDAVDLPKTSVDHTSPYRQAAKGAKTSEGHLLRINPGTGTVEILAAGLRNPYGIDFNQHGDCFTYDADAEHDMGAPWYRPTRILQLTTGGDFGWRGVTGSWPAYYPDHPDNAVPGLDIGKGSPTAVKFGTRSNFPARYRQGLYALDWAYGRILLVNMVPRGSGYTMTSETFLKGRPLNVTDLDFGADGSMYLITGGRKTQSKIYRVKYTGKANASANASTPDRTAHQIQCQNHASKCRQTRRELESLLTHEITPEKFTLAWQQLGNSDPWISHAAARVIERVPTSQWEERALREPNAKIAVEAITCLMRSQRTRSHTQAIKRLIKFADLSSNIDKPNDSIQHAALYGIQLALSQLEENLDQDLIHKLSAMYPIKEKSSFGDSNAPKKPAGIRFHYQHNQLLSDLLASLDDDQVVSKTIPLLNQFAIPEQRLHFLYVIRNVTQGWTRDLRRAYFKNLAMASRELGGAGLPEFLQQIREDAMQHVPTGDRPELAGMFDASRGDNSPLPSLTAAPSPIIQDWTVEQILDGDALAGDHIRGKQIFTTTGCIHCHRFAAEGQLVGPDLTAAMRRYSRRDLLTSIVNPSDVIAENYRSVGILTNDGRIFTGQITRGGDYRSPVLRLATDPAHPFRTVEIQKSEIASRKTSNVSWMPDGLLDTLTRQQIFDLIAYLESSP